MKESELRKVLRKPAMDEAMDQNIFNTLLFYHAKKSKSPLISQWKKVCYALSEIVMSMRFSKIALPLMALFILGTGSVWAAGLYEKSLLTEIDIMTEDMADGIGGEVLKPIKEVRKSYGEGNKIMHQFRDTNGSILDIDDIDEDGYYNLADGNKLIAPYVPNPNHHDLDRSSGDEAFAEIGLPNLLPTILYEDYLLSEGGFTYLEKTYENNSVTKTIIGDFFPDYTKTDDFKESIYFSFTSSDSPQNRAILLDDNPENYIPSSYTNQGGIICTLLKSGSKSNISAYITLESDTLGHASIVIDFNNITDMAIIEKTLDSLPLTVDPATGQLD